jgi:hypothetical protein
VLSIIATGAFQNSTCLKHVGLSDNNAIGSKGVKAYEKVIRGKASRHSLESLKMCNNGFLLEHAMGEVAFFLTTTTDYHDNNLEQEQHQIQDDQSTPCNAQNLKLLHFFNNMRSGDDGCKSFAKILNHCMDNIMDICMCGTPARDQGSQYVSIPRP